MIRNRSWILTVHKDRIFWKNLLENKEMVFKNGVINIEAAGYNGARTVPNSEINYFIITDVFILLHNTLHTLHCCHWSQSEFSFTYWWMSQLLHKQTLFFIFYNIFSLASSNPQLGQVWVQSFKSSFIKGMKKQHQQPQRQRPAVESFQDFLIELDMKPRMHLVEISIFSLNNVTVRLTKIMNNLLKHRKILISKLFISVENW